MSKPPQMSMPEKVAVVTGASRGIGPVTVRALASDGYAVCLLARDGLAAAAVADEIVAVGGPGRLGDGHIGRCD